jgi:hypothetical protein
MVKLGILLFLSFTAVSTALGIMGGGTCSFDGSAGGRIVQIQQYSDNTGAIGCTSAGILIIIGVIAVWIYSFRST